MIILFIGDSHLSVQRFTLSCDFLNWVGSVIEAEAPDMVVNLGDTFHNHAVLRSEILSEFKKHVIRVGKVCPYFYVLGNHDFFKPTDSKYHALETFKGMHNFKVIDKPTVIEDLDVTFVPYIPDHTKFPTIATDICIAHQTFVGADYGYKRTDVGVDADKIPATIIISGHIHKRQSFGNVIYPGTPFAQGIDDINQSKGVMLFDTETYEYSFVESPLPKWRGMRLEVSQDMGIKEVHQQVAENTNEIDHWAIELSGPRAELLAYIDSKEVAALKANRSIRFKPVYNDKDKQMKVKIKSSSMKDIVSEYVDKVYQGSIDKGLVKTKALEILDKVRIS
jgi:DNA repair exonuclease SbcCD nuclease subunit